MSVRIAHIADVHVRNVSRHAEYRLIVTDFVVKCRVQHIDHIFVGGDVFHTKVSGMSPECIDFLRWMFAEMASVCDVHIILGNHDCLVTNTQRQDAISPIITTMDNPRLHLYKNSGVYRMQDGVNLCVFGILDEDRWDEVKPVPGEVNIACHHGPVYGALTDVDWEVENGVKVEQFNDFTVTLLGDIHRTQFLGFRDVELTIDEVDLHRYPGAEIIDG